MTSPGVRGSVDPLEGERQRVFERLACPECASPQLAFSNGAIRCQPCGTSFPLLQGVPVMLAGTAQLHSRELQYPPLPTSRLKQGLASLGLLPMVLQMTTDFLTREVTFGAPSAQWWTQLSAAVAGGLAFATLLTLFLTPCMLVLGDRVGAAIRRRQARRRGSEEIDRAAMAHPAE